MIGNQYGPGNGTILLDKVQCIGNETSIAECDHNYVYRPSCNHSQDVSVSCGTTPVQYGKFNSNNSHCQSLNEHYNNINNNDNTNNDDVYLYSAQVHK